MLLAVVVPCRYATALSDQQAAGGAVTRAWQRRCSVIGDWNCVGQMLGVRNSGQIHIIRTSGFDIQRKVQIIIRSKKEQHTRIQDVAIYI